MPRFRFPLLAVVLLALLAAALPVSAQGVRFDCPQGADITNGIEVVVNVRPGTYRATALGIDGFDPIMGVAFDTGESLCVDDSTTAERYSANLPSTGRIAASNLNPQIEFTNRASGFADVRIVVGGYQGADGEFLLLIEDFRVTTNDGAGDPFNVTLSRNMGIGFFAYMIGISPSLDPYLHVIDDNFETVVLNGNEVVACDDAGTTSCWGVNENLNGSFIASTSGRINADQFDAMMGVPIRGGDLSSDDTFVTFAMSSFRLRTTGDYIAAFHFIIGGEGSATSDTGSGGKPTPSGGGGLNPVSTPEPAAAALELTCTSTARDITGAAGTTLLVSCPRNCTSGSLWGTGIYTDDSTVCLAAQHAGVITSSGGTFLLTIEAGQSGYRGSRQNGITSSNWGQWGRSFSVAPER